MPGEAGRLETALGADAAQRVSRLARTSWPVPGLILISVERLPRFPRVSEATTVSR